MSMKEFSIINKIGIHTILLLISFFPLGDGAYSVVYKVKRISDG